MSRVNKDQLRVLKALYDRGPLYINEMSGAERANKVAIRVLLDAAYITRQRPGGISRYRITAAGAAAMREALL